MYTNKTKDELKTRVNVRFEQLNSQIRDAVGAKAAYRKQVGNLESMSETYTRSEIEARKQKALGEHTLKNQDAYKKLQDTLEALNSDLTALHNDLDLNDPRLVNAVTLIEKGGVDIDTVGDLAKPFARDQAALKVIHKALLKYENSGAGIVEAMLYNPGAAMKKILSLVSSVSSPDASLNPLAGELGKVAKMEGLSFEGMPDEQSFSDAVRAAAGLA